MPNKNSPWKNRIIDHGEVEPQSLLANPNNWRIHPRYQRDALKASLDEIGWVNHVLVNKRTGFVVDGHERIAIALSENVSSIPVDYCDLDDNEELKVIATLDLITGMAIPDYQKQSELISLIESEMDNWGLDDALMRIHEDAEYYEMINQSLSGGSPGGYESFSGNKLACFKAVIFADNIEVIEQALKKTGLLNRGEALQEICRAYNDKQD